MSTFIIQKNKNKNVSKLELLNLSKEELADRIIQLEAHAMQLKNIISKKNEAISGDCNKCKKNRAFDFNKCNNRRIFIRLAYLGGKYHGLAAQEDSTCTVEHFLFRALTKSQLIPSRDRSSYHRCGRTDKGVSASGQVISVTVRSRLTDDQILNGEDNQNELPYCRMLNRLLPNDIRAVSWLPLPLKPNGDPYSARFDCKYRTYKYWFPKNHLNITAMQRACKLLIGSHDFRNFCKMDVANGVTSFIRHIYNADIVAESLNDEQEYSIYYLIITANAFLWHQIRCIAGILFLIGNEKEDPTIIEKLLDIDECPQKPQYNMAVESPLNLFYCAYNMIAEGEPIKSISEITSMVNFSKKNVEDVMCNSSNDILHLDNDNNEPDDSDLKIHWIVDTDNLIHVIKTFHEQWTSATIQGSMIKDIMNDLMKLYHKNQVIPSNHSNDVNNTEEVADGHLDDLMKRKDLYKKIFRNDLLIQGVKPKTYTPLLKRSTCETLENRIQHYVKKKKLRESK